MQAAVLRYRHLLWVLASVAALFILYTGWVVALRVQYPYDHLIWAESPFLTNMLKLHNGVELFGPAADANSFVYSPGLEYVCYALLAPFDLHLDVRACRTVNLLIGLAAAAAATSFVLDTVNTEALERPARHALHILVAASLTLVIAKNFTFDICHPDNLHALHIAGGLALGLRATRNESYPLALATAALMGLGILFKQTGALGGMGVAIALALVGRSRWGSHKAAAVVLAAMATTAMGAWWLLVHLPHGRLWLLDVVAAHEISLTKLDHLWAYDGGNLHRSVLYVGAVVIALHNSMRGDDRTRVRTWLWLSAGAGVLPTVLAYTKRFGLFNNLVILDLWAALLVLPALIEHGRERITPAAALVLLTLGLYPTKRPPLPDHMRYGRELENALRADAGKPTLVAHGTAAWIRSGLRDVPLDRSNSVLELDAAGLASEAATAARIRSRHYDRIYIAWPRYPPEIETALREHYTIERTIVGVNLVDPNPAAGWSKEMVASILVYRPK